MDVYEKLMMINADAILPGLFGKSVITLKDKQTIDAMKLNPEKMKHLIDNIILPRLEANIINKFKEFLEILERSDDIMIKDIAKQIGIQLHTGIFCLLYRGRRECKNEARVPILLDS